MVEVLRLHTNPAMVTERWHVDLIPPPTQSLTTVPALYEVNSCTFILRDVMGVNRLTVTLRCCSFLVLLVGKPLRHMSMRRESRGPPTTLV